MSDLTFGQANGVEPLPSQLALREVSQELAANLFACFYYDMRIDTEDNGFAEHLRQDWRVIISRWYVTQEHFPADQVSTALDTNVAVIKSIIFSRHYVRVFNFIQFVCRSPTCPNSIIQGVAKCLYQISESVTLEGVAKRRAA